MIHKPTVITLVCLGMLLPLTATSTAVDPRGVMEGVYNQDNSRDATWRAQMETVDKNGRARRKKFTFRRLGSTGRSKTLVRFTDPAEVRGVGLLSFNQPGGGDRQWMYTPAIRRTRRIAPQERSRRFLGTDFSNEDMAERVLDDFSYKLVSEGEMMDGRRTYKIEARPTSAGLSQYSQIYLWVAVDVPYILHAQMYDDQGQRIREYHASDLEKVSGIWVARRVEISTPADNTRTVMLLEDIRFNTGLSEEAFTQQALERDEM